VIPGARDAIEPDPSVTLDTIVRGLRAGQRLAVTGEIVACPLDVRPPGEAAPVAPATVPDGTRGAEIVSIRRVELDPAGSRTVLYLEEPLRQHYDRLTVTLNANVALSTQGESIRDEVLGSGDGRQPNQAFPLAQGPLTYLPEGPSGSRSTLTVSVDRVPWREVPSFYHQGPRDQVYIVRADEGGQTWVIFGDGRQGARLPGGENNVVASYRIGIGLAGEVSPDTLDQPLNQPSAVAGVTNPVRPIGAADPDTGDTARARAPVRAILVGRVVTLDDYNGFALTFAGIDKARASLVWNGYTRVVHLTILGANGQPISSDSPLAVSFTAALDGVRDPTLPLTVQSGADVPSTFNVAVQVRPTSDARIEAERLRTAVREALSRAFGVANRPLGEGVAASDILQVVQAVPGVAGADVVALYRTGTTRRPQASIPSVLAHWDAARRRIVPDELLVVNADPAGGIEVFVGAI
jgi:predicted phage baseplate assembly protein